MKIKNFFYNKGVGFYLGLLSGVFGLIALILYAVYGARNGINPLVIIMLILNSSAAAGYCVSGIEFIPFISTLFSAVAVAGFFCEIYGTFIDYYCNVNFWGDVSQMGIIVAILVISGLSGLISIAGCFTERYMNNRRNSDGGIRLSENKF